MLFGNKRKAFTNALTTAIDNNKNISIEDILLHQDLSNTIRNEADILYNKIYDNENKYLNEIFQYALFDKKAPEGYQENNKVNQINHNASNFLENCGKRFISKLNEPSLKLINKMLDDFISENNPTRLNRLYAGHFQRFLENFIRLKAFDNLDDILLKIIPFIIENCRILAYQQLLTRILADFSITIGDKAIYSILTKMLARAYGAVKYISEKSKEKLKTSVYLSQIKYYKKEKVYNIEEQPLNFEGKPIPLLEDIIIVGDTEDNAPQSAYNYEFDINWKEQVDDNIDFNDIEDAEIEAYLLIMSIRTATNEQQDLLKQFRDDSDDYQLVESLLYCGTQCNETSLISLEAFKLLDIIFNGSIALSIDPWMLLEIDKAKLKFYKKYADTFNFRPCDLSYQMIHGLPIFWNHRYNLNSYKLSEDEEKPIKASDYFSDIQKMKKKREREKGETAIEIVQPCLICEPPLSSALIYTVTNIFVMLSDERKRLRQLEDQTIETRERMLYIDGTYIDFYNHHFGLKNEDKDVRILDLLDQIIPLPSSDKKYEIEEVNKRRVPLAGFIIDFFLRMYNPNINTFFDVSNETPLSKLSHCSVMREVSSACEKINIYSIMLNYDKISRNILYNIPVHSEFAFGNDFEEEEEEQNEKHKNKILVIVDEFDIKKKGKKKIRRRKNKGLTDNDQQQTPILQSSSSSDIKVKVVEKSNEEDTKPKSEEENGSGDDKQKADPPKPKSEEESNSSGDKQEDSNLPKSEPKTKPKSKSKRKQKSESNSSEESSSSDYEQEDSDPPKPKPKKESKKHKKSDNKTKETLSNRRKKPRKDEESS